MTKFNDRLRENIDEWFNLRKVMTKKDYDLIRGYTHKTENK